MDRKGSYFGEGQPIYIITPFTCRSTSWICKLCYGRSPTHGDLVELEEAVPFPEKLNYLFFLETTEVFKKPESF